MKSFLTVFVIVILGLLIGLVIATYDENTDLEKQNKELKSQLWDVQLELDDLSNEFKDWTMLHDYYYDSTIVALNSADGDLVRTLFEGLFTLAYSIEALKEKHNTLVALIEKLNSKTDTNIEFINSVVKQAEENAQAIDELTEKYDILLDALRIHVSQEKGLLFKKPHDETVKKKLEAN